MANPSVGIESSIDDAIIQAFQSSVRPNAIFLSISSGERNGEELGTTLLTVREAFQLAFELIRIANEVERATNLGENA